MTTVTAFKGFNPDLTCRGFQYVEGETYTQDTDPRLCSNGFHATLAPIDVLRYYPASKSVFHEVELVDVVGPREGEDSKVASRTIKIGARIELPALIKAQVEFVMKNAKKVPGATSKKDNAAVSAEVEHGAATASGCSGAATASGDYGAATASGRSGAATASGDKSIAVVTGKDGRAKGSLGSWIVLTERDADWNILGVQAVPVDGLTVKADQFYRLVDGLIVEVSA